MAGIYRCTTAFSGSKEGWTESFCFSLSTDQVGDAANQLLVLHQLRAQMLGREYVIDGYRVSKIRDNVGAVVRRVPFLVQQEFAPSDLLKKNEGDFDAICLIARGTNDQGDKSSQHFLGAPPDSACINGGKYDPTGNGIGGKFNSWRSELLAKRGGWMHQPPTSDVTVDGYTQNVNQTVTLTFQAGTFVGPFPGAVTKIRCRGINNGSQLNRQLLVVPLTATTARTVEQIAVQPFVSEGFAKVYGTIATFVQFAGLEVGKIGAHKRGRPLFTTPGRARKQIRI